MSNSSLWIYGCIGGALPMLIRIANSATSTTIPDFYKQWWVWPATLVAMLIGGLTVHWVDLEKTAELTGFSQKLVVVLVGYGAPSILSKLAGTVSDTVTRPAVPPPAREAKLAHFLRGS